MPDIGMIDLVTPVQAGANIVAQANAMQRQRQELAIRFQEAQARKQEMEQRGELLRQEALQKKTQIESDKHDDAQRALFADDFTKALLEKRKANPNISHAQAAAEAFQESFHLLPGKDIPVAAKGILTDAETQDRNQRMMNDALNKMQLGYDRLQAQMEAQEKLAALRERQASERERSDQAREALRQSRDQAVDNAKKLDRQIKIMGQTITLGREKARAGQAAENAVWKNALPGDLSAPRRAGEAKAAAEAPFDQQLMNIAKMAQDSMANQAMGGNGNVDTEANAASGVSPVDEGDEGDMVVPPTVTPPVTPKTAPPSPISKKFKFDPSKGLVPVQ